MIILNCIQKIRDNNNRIIGYKLQDYQGNIKEMSPKQLKYAINVKLMMVRNLKLTPDNRLVDCEEKTIGKSRPQNVNDVLLKTKMLGLPITEIYTACRHKCYLISASESDHIMCIPEDVVQLKTDATSLDFSPIFTTLHGSIKIVGGGYNLKYIAGMFRRCILESVDLSSFDTRNVVDMSLMFMECKTKHINFSNFDTHNVRYMNNMFWDSYVEELDLSSFDTHNVADMSNMFVVCRAASINLKSFNTKNVKDMSNMFWNCKAESLDLSSFVISDGSNVDIMFDGYKGALKATDPVILRQYNISRKTE